MATVVVTGGAGFIGSHLCEALLALGNRVVCVDNLFTGNIANIRQLLPDSRFRFVEHDIITPFFLDDEDISQIYNLACPASPVHYQYNAIRTIKANTIGVINALGLAKRHQARILQSSTSEVYGDPLVHPQTESYKGNVSTIGPRACYDEGKRVAETLFFDYHRTHGIEIRVARIFNTYGPRMAINDGRVVSNFITQALRGEDITIYGDGSQTRSFCFVSDLVGGLIRLMNTESFTGPVNLGNPVELHVGELAKEVIALTESSSRIVTRPLPADDPKQRKPDITLAKENLGWEPTVDRTTGLTATVAYFREILGRNAGK
ncbi:SDR family oxidoreductase [Candidatus Woesearchaeota archaeon]|nr:SDR family oxidoreductase [Candidatus Woesearchaeota archaeon]